MVGSGGMPSSHSATVCGLATASGITYGGGSFEFAISVILAIIVMYDAMGARGNGDPGESFKRNAGGFQYHGQKNEPGREAEGICGTYTAAGTCRGNSRYCDRSGHLLLIKDKEQRIRRSECRIRT